MKAKVKKEASEAEEAVKAWIHVDLKPSRLPVERAVLGHQYAARECESVMLNLIQTSRNKICFASEELAI